MGKIVLYLAMSVDGYIADEQGGVGWLGGDGSEPDAPGSYPAFYETVDIIVMGWTTYRQIVTELSRTVGPMRAVLLCGNPTAGRGPQEGICLEWRTDPLAGKLKSLSGGRYILDLRRCVAVQLLKEGRIDKLWLSVIPTVLGKACGCTPN